MSKPVDPTTFDPTQIDPAEDNGFFNRHTPEEFVNGNAPNTLEGLTIASPNRRAKRAHSKPSRINFNPKEFEALINDQGVYVRITPIVLCPNRDRLGSTNHVLDCPLCLGDEVIEIKEKAIEDWAAIQGIKLNKEFQVQGEFDIKDAQITVRQGIRLYYWYKIEVLDFPSIYNQVVERGTTDSDMLRYAPALGTTDPFYLIDSDGVFYEIEKNYEIRDRKLRWKGLKRPKAATLYTLSYPILPTFRVLEILHENRYYYIDLKQTDKVPIQLPQQAVIRWDYLAKKSGQQVETPT